MDEYGNIEEKARTHYLEGLAGDISSTEQTNREPYKNSSSVKWEDETDDLYFLEASEDVELAETADSFQAQGNWIGNEIPDELLVDALRNYEVDGIME